MSKNNNKSDLPVNYFSQIKAWMTDEILNSILTKLNRQLSNQDRKNLDNTGSHPEEVVGKNRNIKVCFLPANTISKL